MIYPMRCILALDVFVNVLLGGSLGETMSARAARVTQAHHGQRVRNPVTLAWVALNQLLLWANYHHGIHAELGDEARAAAIVALESQAIAPTEAP